MWLHGLGLAVVGDTGPGAFLLLVGLGRGVLVLLLVLLLLVSLYVIELTLRLILLWHLLILLLLRRVKVSPLVGGGRRHWHASEVLLGAHAGQLFDLDAVYEGLLLGLGEGVVAGSLNVLSLFFF